MSSCSLVVVWLQLTNNRNQVCNAGMTCGALAVFEDQPALARQITFVV